MSREMRDDSKGMPFGIKEQTKGLYTAYERTRQKVVSDALINGTKGSFSVNGIEISTKSPDGVSLFSSAHKFKPDSRESKLTTQSNYFYGKISGTSGIDSSTLSDVLSALSSKMQNFESERGFTLDYTPDIIILPTNQPKLSDAIKRVCGSEKVTGSSNNDISLQYGNWTIVHLPGWQTTDDRFIVMSGEANRSMQGNVYLNRMPFELTTSQDEETNLIFSALCRFGVGFNTWKHIAQFVGSDTSVSGASAL